MGKSQLQLLEMNIQRAQEIVDLGNALERLENNRDFKKVIVDGYFNKEAIRLVHLKSDSNMQSEEMQQSILKQMDGIGALNQYFRTLKHSASVAASAIASDTEMRDEILAEDMSND
jgi:hypothetical protein